MKTQIHGIKIYTTIFNSDGGEHSFNPVNFSSRINFVELTPIGATH
jgi:hypothetical protein